MLPWEMLKRDMAFGFSLLSGKGGEIKTLSLAALSDGVAMPGQWPGYRRRT